MGIPSNSPKAGPGSCPTKRTRCPRLDNFLAAAIAMVVRPMPPLPKKVSMRAIVSFLRV